MNPLAINKTYLSVRDEIINQNYTKKDKIVAFIISLLVSSLITVGPMAIIASLLIFVDLQAICIFLICLLIALYLFLIDFLTLKILTKGNILGLYHIYIVDLLYLLFVLAVICIFIMIGVF